MLTKQAYYHALSQLNSTKGKKEEVLSKSNTLNSCEGQLEGLRSRILQNHSTLQSDCTILPANWRGDTSHKFSSYNLISIEKAKNGYINQIDAAIREINSALTSMHSQLSSFDSTINQLEKALRGGYIK